MEQLFKHGRVAFRLLSLTTLVIFVGLVALLVWRGSPVFFHTGHASPWKCYVSSDTYAWTFKPHCSELFSRGPYRAIIKFNSRGLRDKEYPKKSRYKNRVLFIGDSFLVATGIEERFTIPRLLESAWRKQGFSVEVINGGKSGYTAAQQYLNLRELMDAYQPNIVVQPSGTQIGVLARLHYMEPFVERDEQGRPRTIKPLNYENFIWSALAQNWGSNGLDRFLLSRQFELQLGFFSQSWECAIENLLAEAAPCMLKLQLRDLVHAKQLVESRGAKYVTLLEASLKTGGKRSSGWIPTPPLDLPLPHILLARTTPSVTITTESAERYFLSQKVPFVRAKIPSLQHNPELVVPDGDMHSNAAGNRATAASLAKPLGDFIFER